MDQKNCRNSFNGDSSSQNTQSDQVTPLSENLLDLSQLMNSEASAAQKSHSERNVTHSLANSQSDVEPERLPLFLPTDWLRKNKQELLDVLGQLSKEQLLKTLVAVLEHAPLPGQTRGVDAPVGNTASTSNASTTQIIGLGPEYNTRQLATMCGVSRQAIADRVHKLVSRCWLEPRCTGRWNFDAEEARIILRNPHTRGPLKKYSA